MAYEACSPLQRVAAGPSGVCLAVSHVAVRIAQPWAMATWSEWLAGLWKSLRAPAPGTPEAYLEAKRVGAMLDKEVAKPPGQRDEERVRQLRMEHTKLLLGNYQVRRWRQRHGARGCRWVERALPELCTHCSAASKLQGWCLNTCPHLASPPLTG